MNKKPRSKAETLLFVFGISFAVFILLFIIIATVVMLAKNHRKGGNIISLLQSAPEQSPDATNPLPSEKWSVDAIAMHHEEKTAITGAHEEAKNVHVQREIH